MNVISQREARRLRRLVAELEQQEHERLQSWATRWPGGVNIVSSKWAANDAVPMAIRTARKLGHAVIALADDDGAVRFIALSLAPSSPGARI
jgi:hypothetical protein